MADHPEQTEAWAEYQRGRGRKTVWHDDLLWWRAPGFKWICHITSPRPISPPGRKYRAYGLYPGEGYPTAIVDLQAPLPAKALKAIRRVEREGIVVIFNNWNDYYSGLRWSRWKQGMRRPPSFPSSLMRECLGSDLVVLTAHLDGQIIGGIGLIGHGKWFTEIGAFGTGGDALKAKAIEIGRARGCQFYDLAGISTPGITQFKLKWGKPVEYAYYAAY